MSRWLVVTALAGLCLLAYGPALFLPFIADDYVQIRLARHFVSIEGWRALASDALYRCRATSLLLTYWTDRIFGLNELAFNASSQLLHLLNTLLVFSLGAWRAIGWHVSTIAAAFFAIYQGHQEAVMWYSALPELLVFLFAVACFLFWVLWLQSDGRHAYYAASLVCFGLALLSKESAVAVVGLLALAICVERTQWRRRILWLAPFAALAVVYAALIFAARNTHLHFNDAGTFSIHAPFWIVLARSTFRLFWIWGLVSLVALAIWRERRFAPLAGIAGAWIAITFLPYSFVTYMPFVPSRHTYWASAGLALIVAAACLSFRDHVRSRAAMVAVATLMIGHQCGYLWFKKYPQFQERAAPTERLIEFARGASGPLFLHCFPYDISIAQFAVELRLHKSISPMTQRPLTDPPPMPAAVPDPPSVFCWGHRFPKP